MEPAVKTRLVWAARAARENSYAPYSVYHVGAVALAEDGSVYQGCNVENASYGLTVCAERNAIANMVSAGRRRLVAVAVATSDQNVPCGACLQVMLEFAVSREMPVFLVGEKGEVRDTSLGALMPEGFKREK